MAYSFSVANTSRITIASPPIAGVPATLAAWIRPTSLSTAMVPVAVRETVADHRLQLAILAPSGVVRATRTGAATFASEPAGALTVNAWAHIAGTFSSTQTAGWLNGVSSTLTAFSTTQNALTVCSIGAALTSTGPASPFGGEIADVGIWSEVLTAAEIASLARGVTCDQIRPQSLVFYAPLIRDLSDLRGGLAMTALGGGGFPAAAPHPRVYA